jgi:hypothetical protein
MTIKIQKGETITLVKRGTKPADFRESLPAAVVPK